MNRRSLLLAGLILVTCIIAAVIGSVASLDPSRAWSRDDVAGAPSAVGQGGVGAAELVDALRATGEAASQASLLTTGTGELVDGASDLEDGAGELIDGIGTAADGASDLSDGMVKLQNGMGPLGQGATDIADGVDKATEPLIGIGVVRGQILDSLDQAITSLEKSDDPAMKQLHRDLTNLKTQAENIPISEDDTTDLEALRDGSRDLANQLSVPGYDFYDGIYTATKGAKDLSDGLADLDEGAGDAGDGIAELSKGAEKIDTLATNTDEKIGEINRAIPVVEWEDENTAALAPQLALLIAAFGMLGGFGVAVAAAIVDKRRLFLVVAGTIGVAVAGTVALLVLATGQSVVAVLGAAGALVLSALASAGIARVAIALAGLAWGSLIAGLIGTVQLGLVGWVWRVAATADAAAWVNALAELTPLHWATSALTALGNNGAPEMLWAGGGVLGVLAIVGCVALFSPGSRAVVLSDEKA